MIRQDNLIIRTKIIFGVLAVTLASLAIHIYGVQIRRHPELYAKAKKKYTTTKSFKGQRGQIYDYNGNLLVGNIPCVDIFADPQLVGDAEKCRVIAKFFSERLYISEKKLYKRLMRKQCVVRDNGALKDVKVRYAVITNKVDLQTAKRIKNECIENEFKGIYFKDSSKRFYPKNQLLANILGFTNIDRDKVIAVIGIEKFFNNTIEATKAKTRYERARDGTPLSYGKKEIQEVHDGLNVYLTIQEPIQAILEEELDKLVAKWKPKATYAVMADPYTGNIMAIAQRPTYNPNDRKTMNSAAWRNRITEDIFEPGSTMKPIAIAGALDYGIVSPGTMIDCENGAWYYGGKRLRDCHPYDKLSVEDIIKVSSNIGTAKIALMMGPARLYQTLRRFGFGKKTGIPLKPETCGIFRHPKRWDTLSITRFPIGQGIAVSPLQLVRAYCALANGGKLVKLRLVDRLENPNGNIVVKMPTEKSKKVFFRSRTGRQIIEMTKKVTQQGGTATKAAVEGYEVAGKTGTSQKVINGRYSHSKYFSSFIGFVPAENPAFVLLIVADEAKGAHYGGTVTGPAFKNISFKTLRYMNVKPTIPPKELHLVDAQ